ncbi:unnamed protein product [Prunus armeniaca]|uniref:RRM domain-containing protein n=1 Tax=Prunus armeniaca TaxID=36596 RepID=A0A6J5V5A5_PRUAR|nr:unnamed protein product [Prunus armeniaca]
MDWELPFVSGNAWNGAHSGTGDPLEPLRRYVKGISFTSTEESLTQAFSPFGKVLDANIVRNKVTNKSKGFGYVTFETEEDAEKALVNMNGKMVDQRVVLVDKAWPDNRKAKNAG